MPAKKVCHLKISREEHARRLSVGLAKWRNVPPGMPPNVVADFEGKLAAGSTIRKMQDVQHPDYVCSKGRFDKHAKANPEWAERVKKTSWDNATKRKREVNPLSKTTTCKAGLHPLSGDNLGLFSRPGNVEKLVRFCRACQRITRRNVAKPLTEEQKNELKAEFIRSPTTVSRIVNGVMPGGFRRVKPLVLPSRFWHARKTDPEFARFFSEHRERGFALGRNAYYARARLIAARSQADQDAKDYETVSAMVPAWASQNKLDVVHDVLMELRAGKITRDQFRERVKFHTRENDKMLPAKYAKFGDAALYSLDEAASDDNPTALVETVTGNLWGDSFAEYHEEERDGW
jgi:hypothetical protein